MVVNGTVTNMPISTCIGKAVSALASHWMFWLIKPSFISAEFSMPLSPLSAQRQTTAVMVSDTAQGSMMMTRASPRP